MIESGNAPEIQLKTVEGTPFSLREQLANGPVALVFFKISCPTCQYTLPFLERLNAAQLPGSPCLFGVSQDKKEGTMEFNKHFGIRFPVLLDPSVNSYAVSNAYGITNVPSLFLIEQNGDIAWALNGFHKAELNVLGKRFGRSPFEPGEKIPVLRPG